MRQRNYLTTYVLLFFHMEILYFNNPSKEKNLLFMASIPNDQSIDENILLKYTIITKMGSGAYGHVWKVTDKSNLQTYALKKVYSAFQNQLDAERTYREISILSKIKHQNIVKLQKVFKAKNDFDLYLVFEFVQSDLFKAIKENILGQSHKKYVIYQIAKSLKYVHSAGVIHRDIKPSNILIDSECKIKLCDLGLSRSTFSSLTSAEPIITEFIATRWYRAPQVMMGSKSYSYKSDIWSFACLIYEMYAYKALLPGKDNIDQIQKLLQFKGFPNEQQKKSLKVNGIDKILGHFTTERKDLSQYFVKIENPKLKKLLNKMFQYDPNKRPSPDEILQHPFLEQLRNYESEPIAQSPIQLEQHQNSKLSAAQYKQLIYDIFEERQPLSVKTSLKVIQNGKDHKSIVEKSFKKKSTHLIKNYSSSALEPSLNLQSFDQKTKKADQQSYKKLPIYQAVTQPLQTNASQEIHPFKKLKKDKSTFIHNRNVSIVIVQKPHHQKTTIELSLTRKKLNLQQRTVKYNSLHQQTKENHQNHLQQNFLIQPKKPIKSEHKKNPISLTNSPYQVSLIYGKKSITLNKENRIGIQRSKITKSSQKNSYSMNGSSCVEQKEKLPQLILKPRDKIKTKEKMYSQFDKKPFKQVQNFRNSEQALVKLKRERSFMEIKTRKVQKKGISQYYNKEL